MKITIKAASMSTMAAKRFHSYVKEQFDTSKLLKTTVVAIYQEKTGRGARVEVDFSDKSANVKVNPFFQMSKVKPDLTPSKGSFKFTRIISYTLNTDEDIVNAVVKTIAAVNALLKKASVKLKLS